MEMLVMFSLQRNQCYSRRKCQVWNQFGSSPPRGFNCRTFHSGGAGILPTPQAVFPPRTSPYREPKSPCFYSDPPKRRNRRSSPIPISPKPSAKLTTFTDDLSSPELWAGPAYSNSPPPSSLPIPNFSLRQKCTVSLELPAPASSGIILHPVSKSAPPSPTRESYTSDSDFFRETASATKNLRHILHLDTSDD